jgi:hypothetical protein
MTGLALVGALLALFLPGRTPPRPHTEHAHQDPCETVPDKRVAPVPPTAPAEPPSPERLPALHSCPNCHHPISITTLVLPSPMDVTTITTGPNRVPVSAGPTGR